MVFVCAAVKTIVNCDKEEEQIVFARQMDDMGRGAPTPKDPQASSRAAQISIDHKSRG